MGVAGTCGRAGRRLRAGSRRRRDSLRGRRCADPAPCQRRRHRPFCWATAACSTAWCWPSTAHGAGPHRLVVPLSPRPGWSGTWCCRLAPGRHQRPGRRAAQSFRQRPAAQTHAPAPPRDASVPFQRSTCGSATCACPTPAGVSPGPSACRFPDQPATRPSGIGEPLASGVCRRAGAWPRSLVEHLVDTKYARQEWTGRR